MKHRLQNIVQKYSGAYSGALLIQAGEETLCAHAGGWAHKGFRVPNQLDTRFDTASVTKVFTAAAILQLVQCKALRLDDKIVKLVDLAGTAISPDVTVEHLLTHTSGIADDADEEAGENYADLFVDKPNYSIRNCGDFLPQFAYKPALFVPGTDTRYNNCAFILLGLAIEALTGMEYRQYVTTHIFEACGMENTCFTAMDDVLPPVAEGYMPLLNEQNDFVMWKKNIYSYPPIGTADSGAYTTVQDLQRFLRALTGQQLLSPAYSQSMLQPHSRHPRPHRMGTRRTGYAFECIEDPAGRVVCIYKEGVNAGVEAMCSYYPQQDLSVQLLSNENGCLFSLHRELQAEILSGARP